MALKHKIIAVFFIIIAIFFFFYFRKKPDHPILKPFATVTKNDSIVFRQLKKIVSYQVANSFYIASNYDSALYYYQKALTEIPVAKNKTKLYQELVNRIGYTYLTMSDYKKARYYFNKALNAISQAVKPDIIDADTYNNMGLLYHYEKESDSAFYYIHKAYKIYLSILGDKHIQMVKCNLQIGDVYRWIRFDYYNAEKYYYKALHLFEMQRFDIKNDIYFRALYNLASTNKLKGDFDKALSYGLRALQLANKVQNDKQYIELCYVIVANIYDAKCDFKDAIDYFMKAIEINSRTGGGNNSYMPLYLTNLAEAYYHLADYNKALYYANMTLGLLRKQPANFSVISHTYGLLGLTYIKINQLHLALININKCLTLRREYLGEKHLTTAEAFWLLGRFYECRLNADSALRYYQLALISGSDEFNNINVAVNPSFSQSKNNDNLIEYLACKASVLKKKFISNPKDTFSIALSLKCYELLDSLVAFSRKAMDTEKSRLSFSVSSHELYEEAIESAYLMYQLTNQKQYIQHAFHFFEKNKYLILLEKLNMAEAVNKAGIPDSIAEMEQNLNSELKFVQDQLADELNKKNADSVKIQSLNTKVFKTIRQIEYLHGILEKEYPNYFRIKYPDTTIHLENLQAYSLKEKMNIVQYFWGEKSIYMISVSGNRVNFIRLSNDRELRDCLTHFISLLHEANVTSAEKFKEYSDISYYLYERIIKPTLIMAKPNGIGVRKITIIPDGLFAKLSFETLTTSVSNSAKIDYKTCHYLVYQYNIQYAYSSNILIGHSNANRTRYINQLLGFGYSGPNPSIDRSAKNSLPGTSDEMKVISKYFRTKLFLGADATEYNFKKDVAGYDIIHLALHGTADEEQETDTKLIFRNDKGSKEDGLLYSNEVYNLHLHAKLVVLSACETGIGKNYKGEGVFSLARAFSYAGCSSVVISLWKVNDQATSDLMGNFYENLSKGAAIGQSLYKAKLEYLNNADEYSAHPAFWASFVAFGDMSPLKSRHSFMPWLIVLLVIICGTGFVYKSKLINILFKRLSKKLKLNAKSESRKE